MNLDKVIICRNCGALLYPGEGEELHRQFHQNVAAMATTLLGMRRTLNAVVATSEVGFRGPAYDEPI